MLPPPRRFRRGPYTLAGRLTRGVDAPPSRVMTFTGTTAGIILAGVPALWWGRVAWHGIGFARGITRLAAVAAEKPAAGGWPRLSILVPARDEAEAIGECLRSLLGQDYPNLEIIAVDDRSTDGTGEIMDDLAAGPGDGGARLTVVHVTALPEGWLGKCNALREGADRATGEILLFTDGDILFAPGALRRAVAFMEIRRADHVCVLPQLVPGALLERAAVFAFGLLFLKAYPPLRAEDPARPNSYLGVGAFNMLRASHYRAFGGHEAVRLDVLDDVHLGRASKRAGGRCAVAEGTGQVSVRWYPGLWAMVRGLEKNTFAAIGYRPWLAAVGVSGLLLIAWGPWIAVATLPGWPRWLGLATALIPWVAAGAAGAIGTAGAGLAVGMLAPVGFTITALAIARSAIICMRRGGIRWRDSFYPLEQLRRFHGRSGAAGDEGSEGGLR